MSHHHRLDRRAFLNRRAFLKSAGVTAALGAVGAKSALATQATDVAAARLNQAYDFDEIYDRVGTDCSKWDNPIGCWATGEASSPARA